MKILVTGALGFIASHLVDKLIDQGHEVHGFDAQKIGSDLRNCNIQAKYITGDLITYNLAGLLISEAYDQIYHLAAESHVDRAIADPQPFIDSNITGTYRLFQAVAACAVAMPCWNQTKVLLFSTDELMGELDEGSFKEEDVTLPKNMYSMTKQAQEAIARSYFYSHNIQVITSRCSNIYGQRQYPEKLLPVIINSILNNASIPIYGDGKQVREWTHVSDAVDAAIFVMENGNVNETYHIGSGIEKENIDVVKFVLQEMKKDETLISYVEDRIGHDKRYSLCVDKVNKMGWKAQVGFEEGIKETIKWYKINRR